MNIGIDIGGTNIKGAVLDRNNKITDSFSVDTPANLTYPEFIKYIAELYGSIKDKHKISSLGIGVAGHVDYAHGRVIFSPNLQFLNNTDICDDMEKLIKIRPIVENDVNCFVLSEYKLGAGRGTTNAVGLAIGTGIGGGIIINGNLYRGTNHLAGELGHISINSHGKRDRCGGYGCVEEYVSKRALVAAAKENFRKDEQLFKIAHGDIDALTPKLIVEAAGLGDMRSIEIIDRAALYFATAINSINNILDPEVFIVGGGIAQAGPIFLDKVKKYFKERSFGGENYKPIKTAELGVFAGAIGAALLTKKEK